MAEYRKESVNSIDIYSPHDFEAPFPLTIDIASIFGFKSLCIEGWKLM